MNNIKDFAKVKEVLSKRGVESIAKHFSSEPSEIANAQTLIPVSPTDLGVCRNGGRRGTSFAPQAILSILKKMAAHGDAKYKTVSIPVSDKSAEEHDFPAAQQDQVSKLTKALESFNGENIIHIGGGHDHVYPLLKACEVYGKKIKAINIDAHMDTRTDDHPHSGTPFRQFARESKVDFELIQLGVHEFSNTESTIAPLERGKMEIVTFDKIQEETDNFNCNLQEYFSERFPLAPDEIVILSLDCDAIDAGIMEGVSAVNHDGFSLHSIKELYRYVKERKSTLPFITGIYEYNPVYDGLGQKGARALASLIYRQL